MMIKNLIICTTLFRKTVKKVEILPYHTLGIFKWENLGIKYPLEGYKPPTKEEVEKAEKILHIEK